MKRRYIIDLDELLDRRQSLQKELDGVCEMIEFITSVNHETVAKRVQEPMSEVVTVPEQKPLPLGPYEVEKVSPKTGKPFNRRFKQGARRVLILHLYTGPAKESELVRTLSWPEEKVRSVLIGAQRDNMVFFEQIGPSKDCWRLTLRGKDAAEFFQRHPTYSTYKTGSMKGADKKA